jgi:hypothetical protein
MGRQENFLVGFLVFRSGLWRVRGHFVDADGFLLLGDNRVALVLGHARVIQR